MPSLTLPEPLFLLRHALESLRATIEAAVSGWLEDMELESTCLGTLERLLDDIRYYPLIPMLCNNCFLQYDVASLPSVRFLPALCRPLP